MYIIQIKQIIKQTGTAAASRDMDIERVILEQRVEELDVRAVIAVVNGLDKTA